MDEISYAKAGEAHIAYRVSGEPGAVDVVVVSGALFPFEILAEDRVAARFVDGFHSLGRVVVFDRRGVGLSDPLTDWSRSTQEQWADDLIAVIEAARLVRPVVVSWEFLGTARRAAARRPDLFGHLVLVNPAESTRPMRELITQPPELAGPTVPTRAGEDLPSPSRREDPELAAWMSRAGRSGASPAAASQMWAHLLSLEGSLTPTGIGVPTLVLHNRDCIASWAGIRAVAAAIPGSEIVQVNGIDVFPIAGDVDALVVETVQFVTGNSPALAPERAVAAVLFTDLVDSTRRAVDEGDRRWRDLLDVHDKVVQQCVAHQGGRVVKYTGDGVLDHASPLVSDALLHDLVVNVEQVAPTAVPFVDRATGGVDEIGEEHRCHRAFRCERGRVASDELDRLDDERVDVTGDREHVDAVDLHDLGTRDGCRDRTNSGPGRDAVAIVQHERRDADARRGERPLEAQQMCPHL